MNTKDLQKTPNPDDLVQTVVRLERRHMDEIRKIADARGHRRLGELFREIIGIGLEHYSGVRE